jgi:hypothetical protein
MRNDVTTHAKEVLMNSHKLLLLVIGFALLVAADAAGAQAVRLQPRVMMSAQQLERIQAVANQGPDVLRQYLWRTRMIYNWTWNDLVGA